MQKIKKNLNFCFCFLALWLCAAVPASSQGIRPPSMIGNRQPVFVAQAPPVTFTNQPPVVTTTPAPGYDPYYINNSTGFSNLGGTPGAQGQFPVVSPDAAYSGNPTIYPADGSPIYGPQNPFDTSWPSNAYGTAKRFLQGMEINYVWMSDDSSRGLGLNYFDLNATFAVPVFPNRERPLLITPGFGIQWWAGPDSAVLMGADLPSRTYDAYVGLAWNPIIVPGRFSAELSIRPGIYTDFSKVNSDSWRFPGRAVGIVHVSPRFQGVLGVEYFDRNRVKILPAGGVIWTPHQHARYDFLFPNPKISHYFWTSPWNSEWWWYLRGEYGGGAWTVKRTAGTADRVDVNDLRAMLGLEIKRTSMFDGGRRPFGQHYTCYIEVGYVFEREIRYRDAPPPKVTLSDTLMIGAGIRY